MSEVLKISAERPDPQRVAYAAHLIRSGQVVAIPTDTLYGLAADPFNLNAVEQIYRIKGRPAQKALVLLVGSVEQATELGNHIPETFYALARRFWPGPLSLVIPCSRHVPRKITSDTGKVAVRWPKAKIAQALIDELAIPLTGTSANASGQEGCTMAADVQIQIGDRLPLIVDGGDSAQPLPSTIVDVGADAWKIIREGVIPAGDIVEFLQG